MTVYLRHDITKPYFIGLAGDAVETIAKMGNQVGVKNANGQTAYVVEDDISGVPVAVEKREVVKVVAKGKRRR